MSTNRLDVGNHKPAPSCKSKDTTDHPEPSQRTERSEASSVTETNRKTLLGSITDSLSDSRYADLILKGKDRSFKVHKAIVCPQSDWIAAKVEELAMSGQDAGIEVSAQTDITTVYVPPTIDDETLSRIVSFFYTQDYDHSFEATAQEISSDWRVCSINVPCEHPSTTFAGKELWAKGREVFDSNDGSLTFLKLIYAIPVSRSSAMRCAIVQQHAGPLKHSNTDSDFPALLKEVPEFSADLVEALTEKLIAAEEALKERAHATAAVEPQTKERLSAKEDHLMLEGEVLENVNGTNDDRYDDGEPGERRRAGRARPRVGRGRQLVGARSAEAKQSGRRALRSSGHGKAGKVSAALEMAIRLSWALASLGSSLGLEDAGEFLAQ